MVATHYDVSREKQDHYALISHSRAEEVMSQEFLPYRAVTDLKIVRLQRKGSSQKKSCPSSFVALLCR